METRLTRDEARALGCKYYYMEEKCVNGHTAPRLVKSGKCRECRRNIRKKNYSMNKDKVNKRTNQNSKGEDGCEIRRSSWRKSQARSRWVTAQVERVEDQVSSKCLSVDEFSDEIQKHISKLKKMNNYTSLCNEKDMLALIEALSQKYPRYLPTVKVCPFCGRGKTVFARKSWYYKHNCDGMKKNEKELEALLKAQG